MKGTFHDHFSSIANRYAEFRPHYPAELYDYLATLVSRGSTVWDCAAGSGQATGGLAERFENIIATDASREQIESAKPLRNVAFRVALAEQSGLPDASMDLITVAQALHWFDLPRFYAEAGRVLRPGGALAVWAYGVTTIEGDAVNALAQHFYANVVGPYWPPERRLVEEGYRGIPFPFVEITPPPLRMEARWTLDQLIGYFTTWSATNRCMKSTGLNPIEPLSAELSRIWGDPGAARLVTWPMALRVARK
ncbi:MAG: class I SAM-dependent methyltransferase [Verrucomicrobia bacterium]|nr:class I SAM-dependent methyltransferase [Verrucomicrobiota bacterium]MBI3867598.1 class I SAM-dependent methyltransferase [Verrucomicrobiota bacterium]